MKRVSILGGGISGLATAYFLHQKYRDDIEITLLEKSSQLGGWIQTENKEGFVIEKGPRSFRLSKESEYTLHLVESLSLEDQLVFSSKDAKTRYLYMKGKLEKVPSDPLKMLLSPLFKGAKRSFIKELFVKPSSLEDETIHSFFSRHFSKPFADKFASALTYGIYAGDSEKLSAKACFPNLHRLDQRHGSLIKGMMKEKKENPFPVQFSQYKGKGQANFKQGMHTLIKALEKAFEGRLLKNCEVRSITKKGRIYELDTSHGCIDTDHIISCLPLPVVAKLLKVRSPNLKSASLSLVAMGFKKSPYPLPEGYGYLIPKSERDEIFGSVWDSQVFPKMNDKQLLTIFIPGCSQDTEEKAFQSLKNHFGVEANPDLVEITKAHSSISHYQVGFIKERDAFLEEMNLRHPHITFSGASLFGPAVNQCTAKAYEVAKAF